MVIKCEGCGVEHDDPVQCPTCNQKNPEKPVAQPVEKPAPKQPKKKAKKAR